MSNSRTDILLQSAQVSMEYEFRDSCSELIGIILVVVTSGPLYTADRTIVSVVDVGVVGNCIGLRLTTRSNL